MNMFLCKFGGRLPESEAEDFETHGWDYSISDEGKFFFV